MEGNLAWARMPAYAPAGPLLLPALPPGPQPTPYIDPLAAALGWAGAGCHGAAVHPGRGTGVHTSRPPTQASSAAQRAQ